MARQITDWLCFGIAPELQAPRPEEEAAQTESTDPAGQGAP
jgi:hypothetical protein